MIIMNLLQKKDGKRDKSKRKSRKEMPNKGDDLPAVDDPHAHDKKKGDRIQPRPS